MTSVGGPVTDLRWLCVVLLGCGVEPLKVGENTGPGVTVEDSGELDGSDDVDADGGIAGTLPPDGLDHETQEQGSSWD